MNKIVMLAAAAGTMIAGPAMGAITSIVNNIPGTFVNIQSLSGVNTLNNVTASNDDCSYSFVMPFTNADFPNSPARVVTNGFLQFGGTVTNVTWNNSSIGPTGNPWSNNIQTLAPFHDDMVADARQTSTTFSNSRVQWISGPATSFGLPAAAGNVLIVQWTRMDLFATANTASATFQVQIFQNNLGGVAAQYLYSQVVFNPTPGAPGAFNNNGALATVGYANSANGPAGSNNVQWSFNTASVNNGDVLSLVPTPGAMALLGLGGLLAARRRR